MYTLRRLLFFIPTLWVISIIVFALSKMTPGDPVESRLQTLTANGSSTISKDEYTSIAHELGLDKPSFYFNITSQAYPKNLYTILNKTQRTATENLIKQYGNYDKIAAFHQSINQFLLKIPQPDTLNLGNNLQQLLIQDDDEKITFIINDLLKTTQEKGIFNTEIQAISAHYETIKKEATRHLLFIPVFHWYGFDNQYHHWLSNFLTGHFGETINGQSVLDKIARPLSITLIMSLLSLIFSFSVGISIGIFTAANNNKRRGRWLKKGLFAAYSLPSFWVTLMALRFLTTPQYGLKIFPSAGLSDLSMDASFFTFFIENIGRMVLPILCMSIHPITVIAQLLQSSMLENLQLDYTRTALAKGLSFKKVLNKHVFRNSIFPMITLLGHLIPHLIGGSFMVEYIFNIKGMGRVAFEALGEQDWNVVYVVLMMSATMVLVGNLISDLLYKWANPRVEL